MNDYAYLDDDNNVIPISFNEYLALRGGGRTREASRTWARVGQDEVNGLRVSTVFLGMDHGFGGTPLWFETMVFPSDSYSERFCERYSTYDQAKSGHEQTVQKLKDGTLEMCGP